ncbi:MAG: hypothetical protein AAFR73_10065 [Pseudomonadota bacterium]
MDVLSPLLHVAVKSLVMLFPLTVGWLAFRRLALSKSANAWVYAGACLFSAIAAASILPWGLGLTPLNWGLLLLALLSPVVWIATIFVCDMSRGRPYSDDPLLRTARSLTGRTRPGLATLILQEGQRTLDAEPVFKHRERQAPPKPVVSQRSTATTTLLNLARDIRNNATSERRRPKLLAPPERSDFPFLRENGNA